MHWPWFENGLGNVNKLWTRLVLGWNSLMRDGFLTYLAARVKMNAEQI